MIRTTPLVEQVRPVRAPSPEFGRGAAARSFGPVLPSAPGRSSQDWLVHVREHKIFQGGLLNGPARIELDGRIVPLDQQDRLPLAATRSNHRRSAGNPIR